MQTTLIPCGICDQIEKYIRSFIWGSNLNMCRAHLVLWEQICKPKKEGGLGIRKVRLMNEALLVKIVFKMLVKNGQICTHNRFSFFREQFGNIY